MDVTLSVTYMRRFLMTKRLDYQTERAVRADARALERGQQQHGDCADQPGGQALGDLIIGKTSITVVLSPAAPCAGMSGGAPPGLG